MQGRFTSPDPLLTSGKSLQPQSWNRYTYCVNNPLKYVDPSGLDWGYQDFTRDGEHLRRFAWFDGKVSGRGWHTYKGSSDVALADGRTVRLGRGSYEVIGAPPPRMTITGQGNLNAAAGAVDGSIPFGRQIREAILGGSGGVDTDSPEYQNSSTISAGVVTGASLLNGTGELRAAGSLAEESTTLYRAVSHAEFEQMMRTGTFEAGPNSLGGKFFAETAEHAAQWGQILEGKGGFRIVDAKIPTVQADRFMRWERLDNIGPARYGELHELGNAVIRPVK